MPTAYVVTRNSGHCEAQDEILTVCLSEADANTYIDTNSKLRPYNYLETYDVREFKIYDPMAKMDA